MVARRRAREHEERFTRNGRAHEETTETSKGKKSREECHLVRFHGTGDVSLLSKDKVCEFNEESFKLYASGGFAGESLEEAVCV